MKFNLKLRHKESIASRLKKEFLKIEKNKLKFNPAYYNALLRMKAKYMG